MATLHTSLRVVEELNLARIGEDAAKQCEERKGMLRRWLDAKRASLPPSRRWTVEEIFEPEVKGAIQREDAHLTELRRALSLMAWALSH